MIRPAHFGFNQETASSNAFQNFNKDIGEEELNSKARFEFDRMVETLRSLSIEVIVIEDIQSEKLPDAVFPNNWFSTHAEGFLITYPMYTENRRKERRQDVITLLMDTYHFRKRYQLEHYENSALYLEGTGSLILDRDHKIAYACLSPRTDKQLLAIFSEVTGYEVFYFSAFNEHHQAIYHTNVMMALGLDFCVLCLDSIPDDERPAIIEKLHRTGKVIVEISLAQMNAFAGNMLQLRSKTGDSYLIMSETACRSLSDTQINVLKNHTNIISIPIPIIETTGGGSVRCMMAEIFHS